MYRPGKPAHGPPPFGPPPTYGSPFRLGGPCSVPPPGHLPPGPCAPFSASASDSHFLHNRPPRGHFTRPHCSSFSIDHSTVIGLGGRRQIGPPAEPTHTQVPQWHPSPAEHHSPDNSDRAGEEFLRCIAANKPLPDYLKGNMAYNLADAFQSAKVLKEVVKSDLAFQKHVNRSRSQSRSRGRSQAKNCARSKSHARSRSRGRSKSRARGKSRVRSKSRAHSRSRSHSRSKKRSHVRSKSRVRRSKSRSSSGEKSHGTDKKRKRSPNHSCISINNLTENSLLEGLKLVMNSKEMEERLPTLKDAILTIQASDESKKVESFPDEHRHQQHVSRENSISLENDSMLLPHDRVGSDFSWLQVQSQEDSTVRKADELEDEESFLYGNEDVEGKQANKSSKIKRTTIFTEFSQIGEHAKPQEMDSLALGSQQQQPLQMTSSSLVSSNLDSSECEKIKNILESLGTADISEIVVKMQGQKEGKHMFPALLGSDPTATGLVMPALSDPNVRQALESLQSLIKETQQYHHEQELGNGGKEKLPVKRQKPRTDPTALATKEKRAKRDGSGTTQISSNKHKIGDNEERKREKQARMIKMESLMKEMEGLLKQDGMSFLTPVIGFYCQRCEEFIGDLNSAENHTAIHRHSNSSSKVQRDKHAGDSKGHSCYFNSSNNKHLNPSDRRDHRDYGYDRDSGDHRNHYQQDWRDDRDHRSKYEDHHHRSHRTGQENIFLKEEMRKERMLITVSRGLTPPPDIGVMDEVNKASHSKVKVEDADHKGKSSKDSREKVKVKDESSDSSDNDKGKIPKAKSSKKKKKKEKKKKKDKS
ncbi:transcription initiation factor TFIID subunit 1 isoform X2 [Dicentrarchus labrax]|uniref:transcription initiation factor TFIID subunit 1 isoform X2 n=1 Tax=Dicentrarchus labrax TaxID=13489 RepID=UPI0021F62BEC|nr:transcription initiation factor TFIID subunit 1 isoform X2 [Dicentrarchus labrax]